MELDLSMSLGSDEPLPVAGGAGGEVVDNIGGGGTVVDDIGGGGDIQDAE